MSFQEGFFLYQIFWQYLFNSILHIFFKKNPKPSESRLPICYQPCFTVVQLQPVFLHQISLDLAKERLQGRHEWTSWKMLCLTVFVGSGMEGQESWGEKGESQVKENETWGETRSEWESTGTSSRDSPASIMSRTLKCPATLHKGSGTQNTGLLFN